MSKKKEQSGSKGGKGGSKSGGQTPRTSSMIDRGGKVDLEAIRRAIHGKPSEQVGSEGGRTSARGVGADVSGDEEILAPMVTDATDLEGASGGGSGAGADDDAPNRVVFVLQRDLQTRLDKYLVSRISFMSRSQLQRLIDEDGVLVNGRKPKAATSLRMGDRVEVFVPPPPATDIVPEEIELEVMYEDEHLIVLNKQPDIIVHPARSHLRGTLINALAYRFAHVSGGALSQVGKEFARPGVVHRLDRDTSGVIVFAKNDEAHWRLSRQFENRTVDKRYLALVHGVYEPAVDVIDLPLGPHPSREKGYREKFVIRHDHLGKPSLTIARVRERYCAGPSFPASRRDGSANDPARGFSLVELELKTGRTHQIRVHLSHRGFPIVGDDMYGGVHALTTGMIDVEDAGNEVLMQRQALHATTLRFRHPILEREMFFQAPLPRDMATTVLRLRSLMGTGGGIAGSSPPGSTIDLQMLIP